MPTPVEEEGCKLGFIALVSPISMPDDLESGLSCMLHYTMMLSKSCALDMMLK